MLNPEKLKIFDINRPEFKPYGLTVEKWTPRIMSRPDRHNEIEINLLTDGSITYLINDRKILVPSHRLAVFWALIPHQIVHFDMDAPYYVCTIPLSQFMDWRLPTSFVNHVLNGEVVDSGACENYLFDEYLMQTWLHDISAGDPEQIEVSTMEIRVRLNRLALNATPVKGNTIEEGGHYYSRMDIVEKMIIFIARNYTNPIKIEDIGHAVGLHPDYANTLFKKSFDSTLAQYILQQRLLHVQRHLSVSNKSITEIAFEAGFNSLSRFNAAFRAKCKCSPREYRKKHYSLN